MPCAKSFGPPVATESALAEREAEYRILAENVMEAITDLGVVWWMDDFGTGYSSISHLRDLPISGLKLDKSFTDGLSANENHATRLAHGLVGLAHGLGLHTVAEGVETAEQGQILLSQGWGFGQGCLYGKPRAVPLA